MLDNDERLDFSDLSSTAIDIPIGKSIYILREASGDAAIKYRNAVLKATKLSDGKVSGLDGLADTEAYLVHLCLFETLRDSAGSPTGERNVPIPTIRNWPNRVQKALYDRAKKISSLEEKATKESLTKQLNEIKKQLAELEDKEKEAGGDENPTESSRKSSTGG